MDNTQVESKLLHAYRDLISLHQEQLHIATMERYDDQIVHIQNFEKKKTDTQALIQNMLNDINGYSSLSEQVRDQLSDNITELQGLNDQVQHIVDGWYSEDSKSMKQVRVQRTTLQAYGGVNSSDFVSYYFDDKK